MAFASNTALESAREELFNSLNTPIDDVIDELDVLSLDIDFDPDAPTEYENLSFNIDAAKAHLNDLAEQGYGYIHRDLKSKVAKFSEISFGDVMDLITDSIIINTKVTFTDYLKVSSEVSELAKTARRIQLGRKGTAQAIEELSQFYGVSGLVEIKALIAKDLVDYNNKKSEITKRIDETWGEDNYRRAQKLYQSLELLNDSLINIGEVTGINLKDKKIKNSNLFEEGFEELSSVETVDESQYKYRAEDLRVALAKRGIPLSPEDLGNYFATHKNKSFIKDNIRYSSQGNKYRIFSEETLEIIADNFYEIITTRKENPIIPIKVRFSDPVKSSKWGYIAGSDIVTAQILRPDVTIEQLSELLALERLNLKLETDKDVPYSVMKTEALNRVYKVRGAFMSGLKMLPNDLNLDEVATIDREGFKQLLATLNLTENQSDNALNDLFSVVNVIEILRNQGINLNEVTIDQLLERFYKGIFERSKKNLHFSRKELSQISSITYVEPEIKREKITIVPEKQSSFKARAVYEYLNAGRNIVNYKKALFPEAYTSVLGEEAFEKFQKLASRHSISHAFSEISPLDLQRINYYTQLKVGFARRFNEVVNRYTNEMGGSPTQITVNELLEYFYRSGKDKGRNSHIGEVFQHLLSIGYLQPNDLLSATVESIGKQKSDELTIDLDSIREGLENNKILSSISYRLVHMLQGANIVREKIGKIQTNEWQGPLINRLNTELKKPFEKYLSEIYRNEIDLKSIRDHSYAEIDKENEDFFNRSNELLNQILFLLTNHSGEVHEFFVDLLPALYEGDQYKKEGLLISALVHLAFDKEKMNSAIIDEVLVVMLGKNLELMKENSKRNS